MLGRSVDLYSRRLYGDFCELMMEFSVASPSWAGYVAASDEPNLQQPALSKPYGASRADVDRSLD